MYLYVDTKIKVSQLMKVGGEKAIHLDSPRLSVHRPSTTTTAALVPLLLLQLHHTLCKSFLKKKKMGT